MDIKFKLILKSLVCVGLTVSTSIVSLTKNSTELSANAQTGVGEAIAIAKLATEIIDWFNSPNNPVGAASHLGPNQCRNVTRYNRTVAALRRVELDKSAESVRDLNRFINASSLQKNCVNSVMAGNFNAFYASLEEAVEAINNPSRIESNPAIATNLSLVLDANNGSGNLYLHSQSDTNNSNHLWEIVPLTDGYHMIISKRNGYALDANGGTGHLYLHPNPDSANLNHLWRLTQLPGDYWMIISRVNGYALDANGGTGNLYLNPNPDQGNANHLWKLAYFDGFTIIGSALRN